MSQEIRVIIVAKKNLDKCPEAFQQYVREYFSETTELTMPCMIGFQIDSGFENVRSLAPRQDDDLRGYQAGLEEGQNLNSWIEYAAKKKILWLGNDIWNKDNQNSSD